MANKVFQKMPVFVVNFLIKIILFSGYAHKILEKLKTEIGEGNEYLTATLWYLKYWNKYVLLQIQ
jgi:hypothetical protein